MTKPALSIRETIDRNPAEVWDALTNWADAPRWMPGIDTMAADGPTVAGTELTFRARGRDRRSVIAAVEEGRSVSLRSTQAGVTADYVYEVRPADTGGTEVSLVATCRTRGPLWTAAAPALRAAMRRADGSQLQQLKQMVEG